ncbi:MAG: hypothetical protein V4773_25840 [Verrucomicrobiota bacterium]
MSAAAYTVFVARAERQRGTVHLAVTTDRGDARLRFTPALAKQLGRELVQQADKPDTAALPHAQTGGRSPILKPSGGLL